MVQHLSTFTSKGGESPKPRQTFITKWATLTGRTGTSFLVYWFNISCASMIWNVASPQMSHFYRSCKSSRGIGHAQQPTFVVVLKLVVISMKSWSTTIYLKIFSQFFRRYHKLADICLDKNLGRHTIQFCNSARTDTLRVHMYLRQKNEPRVVYRNGKNRRKKCQLTTRPFVRYNYGLLFETCVKI